ncbi:MAG: acyl carrier protein, partial [Rickettsiales bacterium]|nr:acyl carrier protein [Rickettsiales bacterium]
KVCAIWAEVLGLPEDKVSIHDDFFRLGGNSILAIKLVSKLNKELSSQISVKDIFEIKSVSKILELGIFNISCDEPELYVPFSVVNREI